MLTRFRVSGFKNLVDVDVRFGPFTCIAGANNTGKSNLFDAIRFLSFLADRPLLEAARAIRDEVGHSTDVRSLFHHYGDKYADKISLEAEMIIPASGRDDLGQQATASITFLKYSLELAYRSDPAPVLAGPLEIVKEELVRIIRSDARNHILFRHSPMWRQSIIQGRRASPFISTEGEGDDPARRIKLHQDRPQQARGAGGRPQERSATDLPRTVLSYVNAAESPTAVLAKAEMASWRFLQLEPSALRQSDGFESPAHLGSNGAHLPATLDRLARLGAKIGKVDGTSLPDPVHMYGQVANRLSELIDNVREIWVDRDERRQLLTLYLKGYDGTNHPARALSDGTLRFLALAVIELDPEEFGLLCLEEPENGIHPARIPAMIQLLQDIATDPTSPVEPDNPLRQVIVNTHSPVVVQQVPDDSLLIAHLQELIDETSETVYKSVRFGHLPGTWRSRERGGQSGAKEIARGELLAYLNPVSDRPASATKARKSSAKRLIDRPDFQLMMPGIGKG